MIDRGKVVAVLERRFPGAPPCEIARAANAIVGLEEGWDAVDLPDEDLGYHFALQCDDLCLLARGLRDGVEFLVLARYPRTPARN